MVVVLLVHYVCFIIFVVLMLLLSLDVYSAYLVCNKQTNSALFYIHTYLFKNIW